MKLKLNSTFLLAAVVVAFTACAQSKKSAATSNKDMKLIEASAQKISADEPGGEAEIKYRFVVVWKATDKPETFFWRGADGWLNCEVNRVHKTKSYNAKNGELWYTTEFVSFDNIKKGDTLELAPVMGGRFAIPDEIPAKAKNTIFYKKAKNNQWLSLPLKTIKTNTTG